MSTPNSPSPLPPSARNSSRAPSLNRPRHAGNSNSDLPPLPSRSASPPQISSSPRLSAIASPYVEKQDTKDPIQNQERNMDLKARKAGKGSRALSRELLIDNAIFQKEDDSPNSNTPKLRKKSARSKKESTKTRETLKSSKSSDKLIHDKDDTISSAATNEFKTPNTESPKKSARSRSGVRKARNKSKDNSATSKRSESKEKLLQDRVNAIVSGNELESPIVEFPNKARSRSRGRQSNRDRHSKAPPKLEKKLKIIEAEPEIASPLFQHLGFQPSHYEQHVAKLQILRADSLVSHAFLKHPVVQVHVVDMTTGEYLLKNDPARPVTRFNEPSHINYILPTITKAFDLHANFTKTPIWNDEIIFNESFLHLIHPNTLILFEIVDFVTHVKKNANGPWHRVAWGFLKLVGNSGKANTERELRLQLFKFPSKMPRDSERTPGVYRCWQMKRNKYPSTL